MPVVIPTPDEGGTIGRVLDERHQQPPADAVVVPFASIRPSATA